MILSLASIQSMREIAALYPFGKSAILPCLTIAYRQLGYLSEDLYREIAEILGVSESEVASAASFYTMFPKNKTGKYLIQVCINLSCSLMGAESLLAYLCRKLKIEPGEISEDGLFTIVEVECLGACTTAPVMQINQTYYENLTVEKVDRILEELKRQA